MARLLTVWVVVAVSAVSAGVARAAPGDLDASFSGNGKVVTTLASSDFGEAVAVQPNGKIVVAASASGRFALARYTAGGRLDSTFSNNGTVRTSINRCECASAYAIAVQPDGKIVVSGETQKMALWGRAHSSIALVRYRRDGKLDRSFGHNGKVVTNLGRGWDAANAVIVRPSGKIIAAGTAGGRTFALARYNPDGTLDPTFDDDGKAFADIAAGRWEEADDLAVQLDGKLVAAGHGPGVEFTLVRFTRSGALDPSFGEAGIVTTDFGGEAWATGVTIQANGKIVAAANADGFVLARYNVDGSLDSAFDGDGEVVTPLPRSEAGDLVIQEDGRIIAAGGSSRFRLARYNPDGSLDSTFGDGGTVSTSFRGQEDWIASVALQANGKIVAVGSTGYWGSDEVDEWHHVAVARYLDG
jgi:uncharacterized delta-60 repeat protein